MKKRRMLLAVLVITALFSLHLTAYAGTWQQDIEGILWRNDDGTYAQGEWKWIDSDLDGWANCYFFDLVGHAWLEGMAPDGHYVLYDGVAGAWIENGQFVTMPADLVGADRLTDYNGFYRQPDYTTGEFTNYIIAAPDPENPGLYTIQVGFYRLMDGDGFATISPEGYLMLNFLDPNGNWMTGYMWAENDYYNMVITHSDWAYIPEGTIYYGYYGY